MTGPQYYRLIITLLLINIPYILFIIFSIIIWNALNMIACLIFALSIQIITNLFCWITSLKDPGVLFRQVI